MDFDYDMDEQASPTHRTRYDFSKLRPGASLHVATDAERCRVMAAFKYFVKKRPTTMAGAYATSAKVGAEDPRGPGFRVWFKSARHDAHRLAAQADRAIPHPADGDDI